MYGIAKLSIIPLRRENADSSEMVSQLLFGETYEVLEEKEKWIKIKMFFDGYEGWMDKYQHSFISKEEYDWVNASKNFVITENFQKVYHHDILFFVVKGSKVPLYDGAKFWLGNEEWQTGQGIYEIKEKRDYNFLKTEALKYLHAPYLWGGRVITGIDCSGFTQQVFYFSGYNLKRDSGEQVLQGREIEFNERKPGDLIFFQNKNNIIIHVGILMEEDNIIHASSKVRIDQLDNNGIWCLERKEHSHLFHSIRRVLD